MWRDADGLLHADGGFAPGARPVPLARIALLVLACAALYGAAMGSLGGRPEGSVWAALKLPLLLASSLALCLPNFYVVNALLGLRRDFPDAVRAILAAQGTLALALAALAPVLLVFYLSGLRYAEALFLNALLFALSALAAQVQLARHYAWLVARERRHRLALAAWFALYAFVSIKLASILRPFVGDPRLPFEAWRADPWSENPYANLFWTAVGIAAGLWRRVHAGS